jgi:hypothetical protein
MILLNLYGRTRPPKRNEYQWQKRSVSGCRARPMLEADNLTAVYDLTVLTMCYPQHLKTL